MLNEWWSVCFLSLLACFPVLFEHSSASTVVSLLGTVRYIPWLVAEVGVLGLGVRCFVLA